jgi:hypothetical protein
MALVSFCPANLCTPIFFKILERCHRFCNGGGGGCGRFGSQVCENLHLQPPPPIAKVGGVSASGRPVVSAIIL